MEMRKRRRFAAEHKGEAAEPPEEGGKILQAVGGELRGRPDRVWTRCGSPTRPASRPARAGRALPRGRTWPRARAPWSSCAGRSAGFGRLPLDILRRLPTLTGHLAASLLGGTE